MGSMKTRLLSKFMHRGGEKNDGAQPSPEEQPLDSPTSPVNIRPLMPVGPYSKSGTNGSDVTCGVSGVYIYSGGKGEIGSTRI